MSWRARGPIFLLTLIRPQMSSCGALYQTLLNSTTALTLLCLSDLRRELSLSLQIYTSFFTVDAGRGYINALSAQRGPLSAGDAWILCCLWFDWVCSIPDFSLPADCPSSKFVWLARTRQATEKAAPPKTGRSDNSQPPPPSRSPSPSPLRQNRSPFSRTPTLASGPPRACALTRACGGDLPGAGRWLPAISCV